MGDELQLVPQSCMSSPTPTITTTSTNESFAHEGVSVTTDVSVTWSSTV